MKRITGIAPLIFGALPLALLVVGWIMWKNHMHTIGLSPNAEAALMVLVVADIISLAVGLYLIGRRHRQGIPNI
jgi:hypothetical protein